MMKIARTIAMLAPVLAVGPAGAGELDGTVSRLDLSEWVGDWVAGEEQSIAITMPDKKGLQVDGFATYGALDPERVAIGAVNVGAFSLRVPSRWISVNNQIDIAIGTDGRAVIAEEAGENDCVLSMRLDWNINWIDVTDSGRCGGLNVRFTGRYDYGPVDE